MSACRGLLGSNHSDNLYEWALDLSWDPASARCHWRTYFGYANPTYLEIADGSIAESYAFWYLCSCGVVSFWISWSRSPPPTARTCSWLPSCSVTVISVIRLTYIVRIRFDTSDVTMILVDTMIWTSVEACIAIVCGRFKVSDFSQSW